MLDPTSSSPPLAQSLAAAARIVSRVLQGQTPDMGLAELPVALRPSVMNLVFNSLRAYGRGDFFLSELIPRALKEPLIRSLLLVTMTRLESHPDEAHTIVNQAVKAASSLIKKSGEHYKGLVNGVLRNFIRRGDELGLLLAKNPVAHWQHPDWWIKRLQRDHPDHWQSILVAGNSHPPMTLRVNIRRQADNYMAMLRAAGIEAGRQENQAILLDKPVPVDRIPGFHAGHCSVQDLGAQHAAHLLDVHDGQRVLDACAAPGGKAAHLLELAHLDLTALDADPTRANRIIENLERLGLAASVRTAKAQDLASWWDGRPFDRILADVPCSASGVVRRHPDAKWLRRETDIAQFADQQATIVEALWQTLAHDGKMLYVTCSIFAEENQQQAGAFLVRHPDAQLQFESQLLPTLEHDGFYFALLHKT